MHEREEIVEYCHRMLQDELVKGTWGNISRTMPDETMAITPSGIPYTALQPADIVEMKFNGEISRGELRPSSEWRMHGGIYRNFPETGAVVHVHSVYACAYSVIRREVPPVTEEMVQITGGKIPVAEYAPPGSVELASNVVRAMEDAVCVLMSNHGLVCRGKNLEEAYMAALIAEKACMVHYLASTLGEPFVLDETECAGLRRDYLETYGQKKE